MGKSTTAMSVDGQVLDGVKGLTEDAVKHLTQGRPMTLYQLLSSSNLLQRLGYKRDRTARLGRLWWPDVVADVKSGGVVLTYPVPHCSILVMLSWRRLFNQARSSCLP
jgi:hypothetical protein